MQDLFRKQLILYLVTGIKNLKVHDLLKMCRLSEVTKERYLSSWSDLWSRSLWTAPLGASSLNFPFELLLPHSLCAFLAVSCSRDRNHLEDGVSKFVAQKKDESFFFPKKHEFTETKFFENGVKEETPDLKIGSSYASKVIKFV